MCHASISVYRFYDILFARPPPAPLTSGRHLSPFLPVPYFCPPPPTGCLVHFAMEAALPDSVDVRTMVTLLGGRETVRFFEINDVSHHSMILLPSLVICVM